MMTQILAGILYAVLLIPTAILGMLYNVFRTTMIIVGDIAVPPSR